MPILLYKTLSFLRVVPPPTTQTSRAQDGSISYDAEYFYIYSRGWKRFAVAEFVPDCSDEVPATGTEGLIMYNNIFFYIYTGGRWTKAAIAEINLSTIGKEGSIMYDTQYLYIYTDGSWRRIAIASF